MPQSASATIAIAQLDPTTYRYSVTLTDTGTTPIGTFWFSWLPGQGYLPDIPTFVAPAGWSGPITDGPLPFNGHSILWTANVPAAALQPNQPLAGFTFQSTVTPAILFANSTIHPPTPVTTATVYSGGIFSDAGYIFSATQAPAALTITASTDFRGQSPSNANITFAAAADATAIFSSTQFGGRPVANAAICGDSNADIIAIAVPFDGPTSTRLRRRASDSPAGPTAPTASCVGASPAPDPPRATQLYGSDGDDVRGRRRPRPANGAAPATTRRLRGGSARLAVDLRAGDLCEAARAAAACP